jgi:polysaccharide export outer membrane protein
MKDAFLAVVAVLCICVTPQLEVGATEPESQSKPAAGKPVANVSSTVPLPADYVIGPEDVLGIVFWRDADMSSEVTVRPDGMITLPLVNDIRAAGLTPEQLREQVTAAASKYVADPNVAVVVKGLNSRKVFITGQVMKPGPYPLTSPTTVVQLIAMAGGLQEFADSEKIVIMRTENGKPVVRRFNYKEILRNKNLAQNLELRPGDTVLVP